MVRKLAKSVLKVFGLTGFRSTRTFLQEYQAYDPSATIVDGCIHTCGIVVNPQTETWLLQSLTMIRDIHTSAGFSFTKHENYIEATKGNIRVKLQSQLEVGIVFDVFVRHVYRLLSPEPFTMIDIGANIGISALYFAQELKAQVIGFELVPAVAARANQYAADSSLADKITIYPFGLGSKTRTIVVPFSEDFTGSTSLHLKTDADASGTTVSCSVVSVEEALDSYFGSGTSVTYMKLDCEGSEYEILQGLDTAGYLPRIKGFLLEYHEISQTFTRQWLEKFFVDHGYVVHSFARPGSNHEMLYAFRLD